MSLEEKWSKDRNPLSPIKNSDITCNSCMFKTNQTASCNKYVTKPISVLKGGVCYEYKKVNSRK